MKLIKQLILGGLLLCLPLMVSAKDLDFDANPSFDTVTATTITGTTINSVDITITGEAYNDAWQAFTPTIVSSGGTIPVYTTNQGFYTMLGGIVDATVYFTGDGGAEGSGTEILEIANFPYNINTDYTTNQTPLGHGGILESGGAIGSVTAFKGSVSANAISMRLDSTQGLITLNDQSNATRLIRAQIRYKIAD